MHVQIGQFKSIDDIKNSILKPYINILKDLSEVYIFGAKDLGTRFHAFFKEAGIKVLGFIDNNPRLQNTELMGCKILGINDLTEKKDEAVIVISSISYLPEIQQQLTDLGFTKTIPCPVFYVWNSTIFKPDQPFDGMVEDLVVNKKRYLKFYNTLVDDKSKRVMETIINFRSTFDFSLFKAVCDPKPYFNEEFLKFGENDIFIDGGGYDGDTSLDFAEIVNNKYQEILFFEPDEESFIKAQERLKPLHNIKYIKKGLYSRSDTFKFNASGGSGSKIDDKGNVIIEVVSIDETFFGKADYIKMDIEGAELEALKGAERQLKQGAQLAISLYHKFIDIWEIPEYIKQTNPNYKLYLRHYTNTIFDTVLYAVE